MHFYSKYTTRLLLDLVQTMEMAESIANYVTNWVFIDAKWGRKYTKAWIFGTKSGMFQGYLKRYRSRVNNTKSDN